MYQSFCGKYGKLPFFAATIGIPAAATATGHYAFLLSYGAAFVYTGGPAEHLIPVILRKQKFGITEGSKIYQRIQAGLWAASVAFGICAEITVKHLTTDKIGFSQPTRVIPIQKPMSSQFLYIK